MAWDDSSPTTTNKILDDVINIYDNLQYLYDLHTVQDLGHKVGMQVVYKDTDEFYVNCGSLRIADGGTSEIYGCASQLTKGITTSLDSERWYYIYVDPPDSGYTLTADDIEYTLEECTWVPSKGGFYHPWYTDWRCIGFVYANSSSQLAPFTLCGRYYLYDDWTTQLFYGQPISAVWYIIQASQPHIETSAIVSIVIDYSPGPLTSGYLVLRDNGLSGTGIYVGYISSVSQSCMGQYIVPVDSNLKFEIGFTQNTFSWVIIRQHGFILPKGI